VGEGFPGVVTARSVADDVAAWIEDFADGEDVPEHVLRIIGVPRQATRKVVGDNLENFTRFYNASWLDNAVETFPIRKRLPTKVIGRQARAAPPRPVERFPITGPARRAIQRRAANQFFDWLEAALPQNRFVALTFPNINRTMSILGRPRRLSASLGKFAKVTTTSIRGRGRLNHLSLNPNGLLRLGLTRDPKTRLWTPTLRAIPPGPIHIMTRVNRGVKGNITSLSGELRVLTRQVPLLSNLAGRFNLNLRKLGLNSLTDIKNLSISDYKNFDRTDLRGVSAAANMRLKGFNLFDLSRTFRLPWEEAEKLWALTVFEIETDLAQVKALISRKKFIVLQGGRLGPPDPNRPRPILRLVDPEQGDPLGTGGRPSVVPRVTIPRSVEGAAERRSYVYGNLPASELRRVAALRLAGDYSTIRHLRLRDRLTWTEIAARMQMTETRVRKIFREGTTGRVK
jgi:hypothetical protein